MTKKRRKPVSHVPRTKKLVESLPGIMRSEVVERWNSWARVRQDLFGCIDLLAIGPAGIWGIQVTSRAHHAERRRKILESEAAQDWLLAGGRLFVCSWAQRARRSVWQYSWEEIEGE